MLIAFCLRPAPAPTNRYFDKQVQQLTQKTTKIVRAKPEKPKTERPVSKVAKLKKQAEPKPKSVKPKVAVAPPVKKVGTKFDWLRAAHIPESEWDAVDYIISKESSWNYQAVNASSGATGLCQALPASKMASVGGDYISNPVTQLKWCHQYALDRYGSWYKSFAFWQANNWW